ncbi:hypothetical protein [Tellurirhabdus rosea]|uniref:hypothetical protein n=1 Tax=Tellurirhabdus rosea TaxID=2674997 RepID=UPI00225217F7|nr:hypothetical protein [Tellurirhabdus rosea]
MMEALTIPKETVGLLRFPAYEVLPGDAARAQRLQNLQKALALGNLEKQKVVLFFDTVDGLRTVEATIWAVLDDYVLLKGGNVIPIRVIRDVHF